MNNTKQKIKYWLTLSIILLWALFLYDRCFINRVGPKGDQGIIGLTGPQGAKGETGPQGAKGKTGPQGAKSESGIISTTFINTAENPIIVDTLTEIMLEYYFDATSIDIEFRDTVVNWANKLMVELELNYYFKTRLLKEWNDSLNRDTNRVIIKVVHDTIRAPEYIVDKYIYMPHILYKDPIILLHEMIHYLDRTNIHVTKEELRWRIWGCYVEEDGCLNLMRESRTSDRPFTFLLTEKQKKLINTRDRNNHEVNCAEGASINHMYPADLINGINIETLVECCDSVKISSNDIEQFFDEVFNEQIDAVEAFSLEKYFKSMIGNLMQHDICPNDLTSEDSLIYYQNERPLISSTFLIPNMQQSERIGFDEVVVFGSKTDSLKNNIKGMNNPVQTFIKLMNYKSQKNENLKFLYKEESKYLAKVFGTKSDSIEQIRKGTSLYFNELKLQNTLLELK